MERPKDTHRRTVLEGGASAVATTLLAGCSGVIPTQKPTYSYEAISGVWTAETGVGRHEMAKIEFITESATQDEEIGTMQLFREEGGEVLCSASMLAHHSDPPSYWADVEGENNPCRIHQRYRFQHNPQADELHWFISRTGHEAGYFDGPIMTRESD